MVKLCIGTIMFSRLVDYKPRFVVPSIFEYDENRDPYLPSSGLDPSISTRGSRAEMQVHRQGSIA